MRAISGCNHCGHVERRRAEEERLPDHCPECGFPMKKVDLLTARMLSRQRSSRFQDRVRAELSARRGPMPGRPQL